MKKFLFLIVMAASPAWAAQTYFCKGEAHSAWLRLGDPRTKTGTYDTCSGSYGEPVTNCWPTPYSVDVQDAELRLVLPEGNVDGKTEIVRYSDGISGILFLSYKDWVLHVKIKGDDVIPLIRVDIMARGTPGNPRHVGDWIFACRPQ